MPSYVHKKKVAKVRIMLLLSVIRRNYKIHIQIIIIHIENTAKLPRSIFSNYNYKDAKHLELYIINGDEYSTAVNVIGGIKAHIKSKTRNENHTESS